jgi:hypothetical protein
MPPSWLEPALGALNASDGSRADSVSRLLHAFPDHFNDEKLVVRAFAAPTLTRLHLARASRDRLYPAPNGFLWAELPHRVRNYFIGLCLNDLLIHRLGVAPQLVDPDAINQEAGRFGKLGRDRYGGIARYLKAFPLPPSSRDDSFHLIDNRSGEVRDYTLDSIREKALPSFRHVAVGRQVIPLDELRQFTMRAILKEGQIVSSFVVDKLLISVMEDGDFFLPFAAATNEMSALVIGRRPFLSVRPMAVV